jgi:hypothetical protein
MSRAPALTYRHGVGDSCPSRTRIPTLLHGVGDSCPSRTRIPTLLLAGLFAAAFLALGAADANASDANDKVLIKGTAYTFGNQEPIAGATIRARGAPGGSATSRADGRYRLRVPEGANVTPYIEAEGHHGIYLQTFFTRDRDLKRINFQVPTIPTYFALATLLDVELDENGDLARCAIVSTASTKRIRGLSFAEFVAYGAHGVAGATASTRPRVPGPVYFNDSVIPDPSLTETSIDGGIIWTEVPRGDYKAKAKHPGTRFASFRASCRDGRVVNANPPWGLYQLKAGEKARVEVTD